MSNKVPGSGQNPYGSVPKSDEKYFEGINSQKDGPSSELIDNESNTVAELAQKTLTNNTQKSASEIKENRTFTNLNDKSKLLSFILSIPLLGKFIVGIYHRFAASDSLEKVPLLEKSDNLIHQNVLSPLEQSLVKYKNPDLIKPSDLKKLFQYNTKSVERDEINKFSELENAETKMKKFYNALMPPGFNETASLDELELELEIVKEEAKSIRASEKNFEEYIPQDLKDLPHLVKVYIYDQVVTNMQAVIDEKAKEKDDN